MRPLLEPFVQFFTSLRLTVVLLVLSMLLVFIATLDQVNLGVWAVQAKYFRSLFVMARLPGTDIAVPVFPRRVSDRRAAAAQSRRRAHLPLQAQLVEIRPVADALRPDPAPARRALHRTLAAGKPDAARSGRDQDPTRKARYRSELAVIDTTDPKFDDVVAIPTAALEKPACNPASEAALPHPYRCLLSQLHAAGAPPGARCPAFARRPGFRPAVRGLPQPITYRQDEQNMPTAVIELAGTEVARHLARLHRAGRAADRSPCRGAHTSSSCARRATTILSRSPC